MINLYEYDTAALLPVALVRILSLQCAGAGFMNRNQSIPWTYYSNS